jgi:hypothetical protein
MPPAAVNPLSRRTLPLTVILSAISELPSVLESVICVPRQLNWPVILAPISRTAPVTCDRLRSSSLVTIRRSAVKPGRKQWTNSSSETVA